MKKMHKKIFFIKKSLLLDNVTAKKVWSRVSSIPNFLLGNVISVYNGNTFKRVMITRARTGFKFGAFSITRKKITKKKLSKVRKKK